MAPKPRLVRLAPLASLALIVAACTSSDGATTATTAAVATTTTTTVATTTTTVATTTTIDGAAALSSTCADLKVALFDLEESLRSSVADQEDVDALSDEEAAVLFLGPFVAFYEEMAGIAESAPSEVAADMIEVAASVEPVAVALDAGDLESLGLEGTEAPFTPAVEAVERLDAWAAENCEISSSLGPEELLTTTLIGAVFGAFGEGLGALGEGLEELGGGFDDLGGTFDDSAETYGDDPELDALWDSCEAGDDVACDDLFWRTFGVYELFAETCGGRADYRVGGGGTCEERMATGGPSAYGDDVYLDSLWDSCEGGEAYSCDLLAGSAASGTEYVAFGATCGGTEDAPGPGSCTDPDSPFGYGDDPELDVLWDGCVAGDADACSNLYFESPLSSAYETLGDTCGTLLARDESCNLVVGLLAGPAS